MSGATSNDLLTPPTIDKNTRMKIGLKIDVDTFRGTRDGVEPLLRALAEQGARGTFFFSVGPDNMGRHLWRLLRPTFLIKMLRSNAASLYGWDILLRGTLWPGPLIGYKLADVIRAASAAGHEVGLHAWDHHAWQTYMEKRGAPFIRGELARGVETLGKILGAAPGCSAAPAWKCDEVCLQVKESFDFVYNSDGRGDSIYLPLIGDVPARQPQIPTTLPTFDEVIGTRGVTHDTYNDFLIRQLRPGQLNVLTVHAEVEGLACHSLFKDFLRKISALGAQLVPLRDLLEPGVTWPVARMDKHRDPGREGWMARQGQVVK